MIKKFVSKSAKPFKAVQWDGANKSDVIDLVGSKNVILVDDEHKLIILQSFERKLVAEVGDFIIFKPTPFGRFAAVVSKEDFMFTFTEAN